MHQNKNTLSLELCSIFSMITGVATAATLFVASNVIKLFSSNPGQLTLAFLMVVLPLILQAVGSAGLLFHWYRAWRIHPGTVVDVLQWFAGFLGAAGIFDGMMRFFRHGAWMAQGPGPLAVDLILVLLFALWIIASYQMNRQMERTGKCDYC
ncbi:MAG: hypothetical protein AAB588_03560 [Patescibacteria group bacterium]